MIHRNIRLLSSGIIAGGALAMGLTWALPARANSCSSYDKSWCFATSCTELIHSFCETNAPPGCTINGYCLLPNTCGGGGQEGECLYN